MMQVPPQKRLQILRRERRSFRGFLASALLSMASLGSGFLGCEWKARQLTAAGLWPAHYSQAVSLFAYGVMAAVFSGLFAIHFFANWLYAVSNRRQTMEMACGVPNPPEA